MFGRVPVARRNILADRRRLIIAVLGIGAAIGLILLLQGLWQGTKLQISAYQDNAGADLFVAQAGTENFLGDTSIIPLSAVPAVRSVPGVIRADPVTARPVLLDLHNRKQFMFLIAADRNGLGGPWQLSQGRPVTTGDEVVIDETLAGQHGLAIGDQIGIMGREFRVVGLSSDTRSWMAGYVFVSPEAAASLFRSAGTTSFILVRAGTPTVTARLIEQRTGLAVIPAATLADNDRVLLTRIMGGPLNLMVVVAFIAGTIIIALTVYSAVVARIREYGIAKAIGAHPRKLFGIVLGQTAVLAALGTIAGFVVHLLAVQVVRAVRPQFWVRLTPGTVLLVVSATAVMALVAAVIPARRITRLDPASVYRG